MTIALLFPGQGAQRPGMLHTLPDTAAVTAVLTEARTICTEIGRPAVLDTEVALRDTTATQLGLLIAGVACARALHDDHGVAGQFVAGHSAGAFAAAVTAGVLTLREAINAVRLRGEAMQQACCGARWGMAAVTGLSARSAGQLCAELTTTDDPVWVANINSATQTVLAGTAGALAAARHAAEAHGARAFDPLEVAVASHGPVQNSTAALLRAHLAGLPRRPPSARYITNTGGRSVDTADAVLDDLASSVAHPVRWYDGARLLVELGVSCTIETSPGHTLTRLMHTIDPGVSALALDDDGMATVAARCRRDGSA